MRLTAIFGDSFLDGFTMAGWMNRLQRPGEATRLLAPPQEVSGSGVSLLFEPASTQGNHVRVSGDLKAVPAQALQAMMDVLKREDEARRASSPEEAVNGPTR
jgi:hypothetical protein